MTEAPTPLVAETETADGLALRTLVWPVDRPRGKALIVHGLGEHAGRYDHVARALNAVRVAVAAYDQRGHGASPGPRGHAPSFGHLLADLDTVWENQGRTYKTVPRILMGHSMGGLVSLAWTLTRSQAPTALVLSAPWLRTAAGVPWWKRAAGHVLNRLAPSFPMQTGTTAEHLTSDPEMIARFEGDPLVHSRITPRLFLAVEDWQRRIQGGQDPLKAPTLILVPGSDPLADARTTRTLVNRHGPSPVTLLELPGMRHEPLNERGRTQVIAAVQDWVAQRLA